MTKKKRKKRRKVGHAKLNKKRGNAWEQRIVIDLKTISEVSAKRNLCETRGEDLYRDILIENVPLFVQATISKRPDIYKKLKDVEGARLPGEIGSLVCRRYGVGRTSFVVLPYEDWMVVSHILAWLGRNKSHKFVRWLIRTLRTRIQSLRDASTDTPADENVD